MCLVKIATLDGNCLVKHHHNILILSQAQQLLRNCSLLSRLAAFIAFFTVEMTESLGAMHSYEKYETYYCSFKINVLGQSTKNDEMKQEAA